MDLELNSRDIFMQLLKNNGMSMEGSQLDTLIEYMDQMNSHMENIQSELSKVREELSAFQEKDSLSVTEKAMSNLEKSVDEFKEKSLSIKDDINTAIKAGIEEFQLKGKEALVSVIESLHIKDIMRSLKALSEGILNQSDKMIDYCTNLANEGHRAFEGVKNLGRAIAGKEAKDLGSHDFDKGAIAKVQQGMFKVMETATNMNHKLDQAINSIDNYEDAIMADREASKTIKEKIADAKKLKEKSQTKKDQELQDKVKQQQKPDKNLEAAR